jgi:multiple sugar transport system ATP-binding protein
MIYVTHDQVEAMTLADRIVVLRAGRIEQVGTPLELYNKPANRFVAGFIGSPHMNFLEATFKGSTSDRARFSLAGGHNLEIPVPRQAVDGTRTTIGVRPQHIKLEDGPGSLSATIRLVEALGAETVVHTDVAGQKVLVVAPGQHDLTPGEEIRLSLAAAPLHLFDGKGLRLDEPV